GYDDIVIGAPGADAQGQGAVHVLYGGPQPVSDTATVTIDVVFDDLTLKPDAFTVLATDVLTGNVFDDNGSGADGTPDGTSFRVVDVNTDTDVVGTQHTLASGAVLTVNADGTFAYDPGSAFVSLGADETFTETFTYAAPSDKAFAPSLSGDFVADGAGLHFTGAAEGDSLGNAVSVLGDINGDGLDDVAFAAPMADGEDGEVYVVFGSSEGLESALTPADLDGTNGFVITSKGAGDHTGYSVSGIGDFNDDGIDDFAIGAPFADRGVSTDRGEIHIVFGRDTVPTDAVPTPEGFEANLNVASLDGTYGFEIVGASRNSQSGYDISGGGDINADGIADLIVGVRYGSKSGQTKSGDTYVIFGTSDAQTVDMRLSEIDGSNGFRVEGVDSRDRSGSVVASLGDFNGDGFDDFVIGAPFADPEGTSSGEAYIVFGFDDTAVGAFSADDLDGTNGFRFVGEDAYDRTGFAVSAAGDLNNDGLADVAIGARTADDGGTNSGSTYIIYGREAAMPATRRPEHLNGQLGTLIKGDNNDDESGYAVASAGDLNSDGIDDLIIGARGADIRGSWSSLVQDYDVGAAIVVYGQDGGLGSSVNISHLDDDAGFILYGRDEYENMGYAVGGAGDINGDGIHDIVLGAPLSDTVATNSGAAYVLFGPERITTDVTITVQGVNDAPVLDLAAALEIDENLTSIDLLEITDVDGDVIVVELTGEDADLFDVHAEDSIVDTSGAKATSAFKLSWEGGAAFDAGEPGGGLPPVGPPEGPGGGAPTSDRRELVFRDAPNFEAPQDADGDGYTADVDCDDANPLVHTSSI
ncbi:MAG: hypothetical protein ACPGFC_05090, partial [Paracoccaceae bacterium]